MIPPIIHTIWIGEKHEPDRYVETRMIGRLLLQDEPWLFQHWSAPNAEHTPHAWDLFQQGFPPVVVADMMRMELLNSFGGIYMDGDVRLLRSPMPLLAHTAFIPEETRIGTEPRRLGNCVIGAERRAPYLADMVTLMRANADRYKDPLRIGGPLLWTEQWDTLMAFGWTILPPPVFCPLRPTLRAAAHTYTADDLPDSIGIHEFQTSWIGRGAKTLWPS